MQCKNCGAEIPSSAVRCPRCASMEPAVQPSNKKIWLIAGGGVALVLLIVGLALAFGKSRSVTEVRQMNSPSVPITEKTGNISAPAPITQRQGVVTPNAPPPQEIIDYIAHVREIDRQRIVLYNQQMNQAMAMLPAAMQQNVAQLMAMMGAEDSDPLKAGAPSNVQSDVQKAIARWQGDWQNLSRAFMQYPKPIPAPCAGLRDSYYDMLGKTSGAVVNTANIISAQNATFSLDGLKQNLGPIAQQATESCTVADKELAVLCDKFGIHKDFVIQDSSGSSNPFTMGH